MGFQYQNIHWLVDVSLSWAGCHFAHRGQGFRGPAYSQNNFEDRQSIVMPQFKMHYLFSFFFKMVYNSYSNSSEMLQSQAPFNTAINIIYFFFYKRNNSQNVSLFSKTNKCMEPIFLEEITRLVQLKLLYMTTGTQTGSSPETEGWEANIFIK